jgi:hypothetical protein
MLFGDVLIELAVIAVLLGCYAVGTLLLFALQLLRPRLLKTRQRLEAVGLAIQSALTVFRDAPFTPPELDTLIDAVLNKWKLLSLSLWRVIDQALVDLEKLARDLRGVTVSRRIESKR